MLAAEMKAKEAGRLPPVVVAMKEPVSLIPAPAGAIMLTLLSEKPPLPAEILKLC